jgi:hypothetical protein
MRARIAGYLAFAPLLVATSTACEGVPDLRFAGDDGSAPGSANTPDATIVTFDGASSSGGSSPGTGSSSGGTVQDATAPDEDAPGTPIPLDAATPPPPVTDGATPPLTGCPGHPAGGVTCCGSVACKGTAQQCNCNECSFCASEGFCCPSTHPPPGFCATSLSACH